MAQHYAPEEVSGAILATELAEELTQQGWKVGFLTSAPSYPLGRVFKGYRNRLFSTELRNGVRVVRTWSFISPSKSFWPRILNFGTFSVCTFFAGLVSGRPDAIFCYSPPLPLAVSAALLALLWGVPWVMRVEDLYPDAAVSAGVLRNRTAIRIFKVIEGWLYRRANHLSLISEGFRKNLLAKGVPDGKISVTPVWVDPQSIQPLPKWPNSFREKYGLKDCFILLYSGNLGQTSALEDVLDAAILLKEDLRIRIVIVGEGSKRQAIEQIVQQNQLDNVLLLPFQPRDHFSELLAAADVGLVTLNAASADYSLPYKTFGIMASARPVLSIAPNTSELTVLIEKIGCGINMVPSHANDLASLIRKISSGEVSLEELGQKGRQVIQAGEYSKSFCITQISEIIRKLFNETKVALEK